MYRIIYYILSCIILISSLGCANKDEEAIALKNWYTVKNAVKDATELSTKRSNLIKEIYSNLSVEKRATNLLKLDSIKLLSTEIDKRVKKNTLLLKKSKTDATFNEIYDIGLKYINAGNNINKYLPGFYIKIKKDIYGVETADFKEIVIEAKKIIIATDEYRESMNAYRAKYNLTVPEIYIPTQEQHNNADKVLQEMN